MFAKIKIKFAMQFEERAVKNKKNINSNKCKFSEFNAGSCKKNYTLKVYLYNIWILIHAI